MKKYNIQFEEEELNRKDLDQYQDFGHLLEARQRILSRRMLVKKVTALAAMITLPVVIALGYINQHQILDFFTEQQPSHKSELKTETVEKVSTPPEVVVQEERTKESVTEIKKTLPVEEPERKAGKKAAISAAPVGGFDALKEYFSKIVVTSDDAQEKSKLSELEVVLWIDKKGAPEKIEVNGNLSPDVKAQIKEAVENMPAWTPAKIQGTPYRSMVSFKVQFQIAD